MGTTDKYHKIMDKNNNMKDVIKMRSLGIGATCPGSSLMLRTCSTFFILKQQLDRGQLGDKKDLEALCWAVMTSMFPRLSKVGGGRWGDHAMCMRLPRDAISRWLALALSIFPRWWTTHTVWKTSR